MEIATHGAISLSNIPGRHITDRIALLLIAYAVQRGGGRWAAPLQPPTPETPDGPTFTLTAVSELRMIRYFTILLFISCTYSSSSDLYDLVARIIVHKVSSVESPTTFN